MEVEGVTKNKDLIIKEFEITAINKITKIPIIAFYEKPSDHPEHYIARLFDKNRPTNMILKKDSLEELRKAIPPNMARINRSKDDDEVIIESYI